MQILMVLKITIHHLLLSLPINGINYQMEVASAQVKSAILFASLFSKEASQITELDISRNHTETMFKHYQIPIQVNQK